jgi:hypothetical protein
MQLKPDPVETAEKIYREKFPDAKAFFLAGSVLRNEATKFSDLDIIVVFDHLEVAYRESFIFDEWPVEVFVHDPATLNYFFQKVDGPTGVPSLASMVSEGADISAPSDFSNKLKDTANTLLKDGPAHWSKAELDRSRYFITDFCDDLRSPRSFHEMVGTLGLLQEALTNFHFRSQSKWSARGKTIPRRWKQEDPALADEYLSAFECALKQGDTTKVIDFSEKLLKPFGGWLFEGFKMEAPKDWRLP